MCININWQGFHQALKKSVGFFALLGSDLFCFCSCSVFCPASTDDESRDLANQKRIRSFNWITPQHLDAAINPDSDKVQQLIEDAQQGSVK